jgi:hypothetical protein
MELIQEIQLAIKALVASQQDLKDLQRKTELAQQKTELAQQKTEEQLKRTMETLSNIGINLGETTEEYFYNSLSTTMLFGGIKYDYISKNIRARRTRLQDEFDIVLYNGNSIGLIECKHKAHKNDLEKLTTKKVENFRILYPEYLNYSIYCGLASFSFYDDLEQEAEKIGVAILKQCGDVMQVNATNLRAY